MSPAGTGSASVSDWPSFLCSAYGGSSSITAVCNRALKMAPKWILSERELAERRSLRTIKAQQRYAAKRSAQLQQRLDHMRELSAQRHETKRQKLFSTATANKYLVKYFVIDVWHELWLQSDNHCR